MKTQIARKGGFTLVEVLVVIGIIAILAGIVLIAINPSRQFAQARNLQRQSNVNEILNAIGQRIADNKGVFRLATDSTCGQDIATTTIWKIASSTAISNAIDLNACLVPTYFPSLPIDPDASKAYFKTASDYNSGYTVQKDATTTRITVSAPFAELNEVITVTR
ncbi:MAG: prepilin-type N-terminal cleavage/methylation domain-containing protein [Candidatus Pacebacteria bacterium]|nr:prepilin-type N-terminal cleavage/methylation domain-containing protein [Candidatus Paceibacterota bacterium]